LKSEAAFSSAQIQKWGKFPTADRLTLETLSIKYCEACRKIPASHERHCKNGKTPG
jgi:hypothetical protein